MAGQVLLKIICLLMGWLFSLAAVVVRSDRAKDAELLVLRHENAVLRRNADRITYEPGDRAWFAVLSRFQASTVISDPARCCLTTAGMLSSGSVKMTVTGLTWVRMTSPFASPAVT